MSPARPRCALRSTAFLALGALVFACAGNPANTLAPGQKGAPGVKTFLVCAPNTAISLAAEMEGGAKPLRAAITRHLDAHGRKAVWVDLYECRTAWKEAASHAKESGAEEAAAAEQARARFASAFAERHDFQAIVMPSIVVHYTDTYNSRGSWDGVEQRISVINMPRRRAGRGESTLSDGITQGGVRASNRVSSVHVLVFSPDGKELFEGRGGLEFLEEIDMAMVAEGRSRFEFVLRDDLFDEKVVREGVAIAFDPYLPLDGP